MTESNVFQSLIARSAPPEANCRPEGAKASAVTASACPLTLSSPKGLGPRKVNVCDPVQGSQSLMLASLLPGRAKYRWAYLAAALLAVNEWALKPVLTRAHAGAVAGLSFGAWHGISAVLYITACAAVLLLIWRQDP